MTERKFVLNGIIRSLLPLPPLVLYIAGAYGIKICLAYVVKKSADCDRFVGIFSGVIFVAAFFEYFINIYAMQSKPALKSAVIFCLLILLKKPL